MRYSFHVASLVAFCMMACLGCGGSGGSGGSGSSPTSPSQVFNVTGTWAGGAAVWRLNQSGSTLTGSAELDWTGSRVPFGLVSMSGTSGVISGTLTNNQGTFTESYSTVTVGSPEFSNCSHVANWNITVQTATTFSGLVTATITCNGKVLGTTQVENVMFTKQ